MCTCVFVHEWRPTCPPEATGEGTAFFENSQIGMWVRGSPPSQATTLVKPEKPVSSLFLPGLVLARHQLECESDRARRPRRRDWCRPQSLLVAGWALHQTTNCLSLCSGHASRAEADAHPAQVYTNTGGDGATGARWE